MRFPLAAASDDDLPARAGGTLQYRVLARELMATTFPRYGMPESLKYGLAAGNSTPGQDIETRHHSGLPFPFRGTGQPGGFG